MSTTKSVEVSTARAQSLLSPIFLIFLVLKLTHAIDWSWWWVTAPLWALPAVAATALVIGAILLTIAAIID